ncbi:MAG: hypothetical protein OEV49_01125 [candidate division Zixibacteria bacterium]|nr:hypothetical protein [candidate division Zixibacteria bacterium]MDH3939280.1 hypothetical protein [candidate division Zixibacteria bacterium]
MSDFLSGRYLLSMLGVLIGVLVAETCANRLAMPILGWFIGGCVIGTSLHIRFPVKKSEWYLAKAIGAVILTGIVASAAYYIAGRLL